MSNSTNSSPRRRNDRSEVPVSFLPEGNRAAYWAYLLLLIGLVPPFGAVCGLPAFVLGTVGLYVARRDPERRGIGHAYMSRSLGLIESVTGLGGLACFARAMDFI
jgi:hypothetical protein